MKELEKMVSKETTEAKKSKVIKKFAVGTACLMCLATVVTQTGAIAYLTDFDHVTNKFTEGKVNIEVSEPEWTEDEENPGDKENVTPGDVFNKDPQVTAAEDCVSPAFIYMQVKVPYGKVTKVNDDGSLYDKDVNGKRLSKNHMLITFGEGEITKDANDLFIVGDAANVSFDQESELLDTAATPVGHSLSNNINNTAKGWTLLQVETTNLSAGDDDADGVIQGYLVFTYSYNSMLANTDKVSEKYQELVGTTIVKQTTPLFDKIRMLNVIEGQLDLVTYQMPIKVFAIQAAHTGTGTDEDANIMADSNGNGIPNTTTEVIAQSKLAYETYTKQNIDNGSATTLVSNFAS